MPQAMNEASVHMMGPKQDRLDGEGRGRAGDDKHRYRGQKRKCKRKQRTFGGDGTRCLTVRGLGGA